MRVERSEAAWTRLAFACSTSSVDGAPDEICSEGFCSVLPLTPFTSFTPLSPLGASCGLEEVDFSTGCNWFFVMISDALEMMAAKSSSGNAEVSVILTCKFQKWPWQQLHLLPTRRTEHVTVICSVKGTHLGMQRSRSVHHWPSNSRFFPSRSTCSAEE